MKRKSITPLLPCMSCLVFPMCKSKYAPHVPDDPSKLALNIVRVNMTRECSILHNWFESIDVIEEKMENSYIRRERIFHEYFQR